MSDTLYYSTSTRAGEGAIYQYFSRQGKIAGISTRRSRVDYLLVDPRGLKLEGDQLRWPFPGRVDEKSSYACF